MGKEIRRSQGQYSVEFVLLMGIVMITLIPLFYFAADYIDQSRERQISEGVAVVINAIDTVMSLSRTSQITEVITIPRGVTEFDIDDFTGKILTIFFRDEELVFYFPVMTLGNWPIVEGLHRITVYNNGEWTILLECGNSVKEAFEQCDGTADDDNCPGRCTEPDDENGCKCMCNNDSDCSLIGGYYCDVDTGLCEPGDDSAELCGNGIINGGDYFNEQCDCGPDDICSYEDENGDGDFSDNDVGGMTCGAYPGIDSCDPRMIGCYPNTCLFDATGCNVCGDGTKIICEQCDGNDFDNGIGNGDNSCASIGLCGTNLACLSDCTIDSSQCFPCGVCGDGTVDIGEECDDGDGTLENGNGIDGDGCSTSCQREFTLKIYPSDIFEGESFFFNVPEANAGYGNTNYADGIVCPNLGDCIVNICKGADQCDVTGNCIAEESCEFDIARGLDGCFGAASTPPVGLQWFSACMMNTSYGLIKEAQEKANVWVCGDGDLQVIEQCDDGNIVDGDGCSSICEREFTLGINPDPATIGEQMLFNITEATANYKDTTYTTFYTDGLGCQNPGDCDVQICRGQNECDPDDGQKGQCKDVANNVCKFDMVNGEVSCPDAAAAPAGDQWFSACMHYQGADLKASEYMVGVLDTGSQCGDGGPDFGEECDTGAQNGQDGSCCSTACKLLFTLEIGPDPVYVGNMMMFKILEADSSHCTPDYERGVVQICRGADQCEGLGVCKQGRRMCRFNTALNDNWACINVTSPPAGTQDYSACLYDAAFGQKTDNDDVEVKDAVCGNGKKEDGETCDGADDTLCGAQSCLPDCTCPACGDGVCDASIDEDCSSCPFDCQCVYGEACIYSQILDMGVCSPPLGGATCTPDCGPPDCGPDPVCGISCGFCSGGQICVNGQCVDTGKCGNGKLDAGEECDGSDATCAVGQSCQSDCTCLGSIGGGGAGI